MGAGRGSGGSVATGVRKPWPPVPARTWCSQPGTGRPAGGGSSARGCEGALSVRGAAARCRVPVAGVVPAAGTVMGSRLRAAALCGAALALAGGMVVALRAWARLRSRVALPARSVAAAADQGKGHSKQILVLGLDGAGKTSILHSLAINHVKRSVAPTEGFNAICIYTEESQMDFLEMPSYTSYTPVSPRSRIHVLAEPKPVFCESSPRLVWGDQETIWTLSWGALTAQPSARILSLSKPKKDFSKYECRCRPVIGGRALLAKFGYPSERLLRLAEPKKYLPAYLEKRARESPEWPVSLAARNYNASQRILELAQPKGLHPDFMPAREVSRSPQKAIASPRTIELSKPKQLHANYTPPRDPEWPVTEAAKRAVATPRVLELAQPSTRPRMGLATLNPDAFRVKGTAMKAACSPRLQELARPIQR